MEVDPALKNAIAAERRAIFPVNARSHLRGVAAEATAVEEVEGASVRVGEGFSSCTGATPIH